MKIGIDRIGIHVPKYYLDIENLASARGVDPMKFTKGLLQKKMAVTPISQDIVTMGAMAANKILDKKLKKEIDLLIVGTETGVDQSKSASIFIHSLLGLNPFCKTFEIKQACYGATAALLYAKDHIKTHKNSKVLVIASDIAKYGINTGGESTQGAGAVAILVTNNPSIAEIEDETVCYTEDIMDFYRPNKSDHALVDGKLSNAMYLKALDMVYNKYIELGYNTDFKDICFHIPYPKLGIKGLRQIRPDLEYKNDDAIKLNSEIGNIYTGSLFLSFYSLISNSNELKTGDRIGMYSYGSGAIAEFFAVKLCDNFKQEKLDLSNRIELNINEYENMFFKELEEDIEFENYANEKIYLKGVFDTKRKYAINE
ncbi:hydroxymethylglutaryl-CoA synthase [Oceanivirga salmonicida]|uniref:hydroxymethylglutaryl-CoA synthase n=1 Tax=Oceanivirga salmonicida TaxID=1769291 RepID=UPI0012E1BCB2|nr:hydroxymethylglutaryl-CoA synthase [Oceanivirga salmonicida]